MTKRRPAKTSLSEVSTNLLEDTDLRNEAAVAWARKLAEASERAGNLGMGFPYL